MVYPEFFNTVPHVITARHLLKGLKQRKADQHHKTKHQLGGSLRNYFFERAFSDIWPVMYGTFFLRETFSDSRIDNHTVSVEVSIGTFSMKLAVPI